MSRQWKHLNKQQLHEDTHLYLLLFNTLSRQKSNQHSKLSIFTHVIVDSFDGTSLLPGFTLADATSPAFNQNKVPVTADFSQFCCCFLKAAYNNLTAINTFTVCLAVRGTYLCASLSCTFSPLLIFFNLAGRRQKVLLSPTRCWIPTIDAFFPAEWLLDSAFWSLSEAKCRYPVTMAVQDETESESFSRACLYIFAAVGQAAKSLKER